MRTLKLSTSNFDRESTFSVAGSPDHLPLYRCSLHRDYMKDGDGIYWALQHSGVIASSYSPEERDEIRRLNSEVPILDGDLVLIDGKAYRFRYKGNYSDCGIFEPIDTHP